MLDKWDIFHLIFAWWRASGAQGLQIRWWWRTGSDQFYLCLRLYVYVGPDCECVVTLRIEWKCIFAIQEAKTTFNRCGQTSKVLLTSSPLNESFCVIEARFSLQQDKVLSEGWDKFTCSLCSLHPSGRLLHYYQENDTWFWMVIEVNKFVLETSKIMAI